MVKSFIVVHMVRTTSYVFLRTFVFNVLDTYKINQNTHTSVLPLITVVDQ